MVIDIENFFPSIKDESVQRYVLKVGFPFIVAKQLTDLCTFEGRLPQGAPTSPMLASIVFSPVDQKLRSLASSWGAVYTRYADDLAFSGRRQFSRTDIRRVSDILRRAGFRTNFAKSRITGAGSRQIVAGLVVNERGLPPREKRRGWRAMFHQASRLPGSFVGRSAELRGLASFVNQYDRELAKSYFQAADVVYGLETLNQGA